MEKIDNTYRINNRINNRINQTYEEGNDVFENGNIEPNFKSLKKENLHAVTIGSVHELQRIYSNNNRLQVM